MIREYGYETSTQTRTFDTYHDVDCWNYSDVHDYIKYLKFGYGKVTDHACREIRLRRMTRSEGAALVKKFGTLEPRNLDLFLDWLGITLNAFQYIVDQHRSHAVWRRNEKWDWELTPEAASALSYVPPPGQELPLEGQHSDYWQTPVGQSTDADDRYILIGKGVNY